MRKLIAAVDLRDVVALLGLLLLIVGLALVSVPLALIIPGALLFGLAVWPSLATGRKGE